MRLPGRLQDHLDTEPALLPRGCRILVGVSGGPDSTALLHLLHELAPANDWSLVAAHFDHRTRPDGRERSEAVGALASALGLPFVTGLADAEPSRSQAALRSARYAWLSDQADRLEATRVATGHQRDDQVETVLFRILRGAGNRGLAGIPARRGRFVRPLLPYSRSELASWLGARGVAWEADPANRDPRYARSRLRHALLPALRSRLPDVDERLLRIGAAARAVSDSTDRVAAHVLAGLRAGTVERWPAQLRAEALRLAARQHGVRLRRAAAREAAERMEHIHSGHGLDLGGGLRLENEHGSWRLRRSRTETAPDRTLSVPSPGPGTGTARLGGREWRVRWRPAAGYAEGDIAPWPASVRVALDVPEDHYPLQVRARAPGDRIMLSGEGRKVSRWMAEARIPRGRRDTLPVVVDRIGRVLCILDPRARSRTIRTDAHGENLIIEVQDG